MHTDLVSKPPLLFERPELLPRVLEERPKCLPLGVSTNDMQIPRRGRREPERIVHYICESKARRNFHDNLKQNNNNEKNHLGGVKVTLAF